MALTGLLMSSPSIAQDAEPSCASQEEQALLKVHFASGSAKTDADQTATLDLAARSFREGAPFVMIATGGADTVGNADTNFVLSLLRTKTVADSLAARGIPVKRPQFLGRGDSKLDLATGQDVSEKLDRSVLISWR